MNFQKFVLSMWNLTLSSGICTLISKLQALITQKITQNLCLVYLKCDQISTIFKNKKTLNQAYLKSSHNSSNSINFWLESNSKSINSTKLLGSLQFTLTSFGQFLSTKINFSMLIDYK